MKEASHQKYRRSLRWGTKLGLLWLGLLSFIAFIIKWWPYVDDPNSGELGITYLAPFISSKHLLGTDQLGRDLGVLLLHGTHTAWLLTFPPLLLATLFGLLLGSAAALLGNNSLRCSWAYILSFSIALGLFLYTTIWIRWWELSNSFTANSYVATILNLAGSGLFLLALRKVLVYFQIFRNKISIPVDELLLKTMEMWSALPKLLLLLLLTTYSTPSLTTLSGWIALSYWVFPARLVRANILQLKNELFIEAARVLGIPSRQILVKHFFPSLTAPLLTNFCFSASGLLGIGSTLAYLGIGIPADVPSWGKLLSTSRYSFDAWWLFFFPAVLLLLSIFSLQALGQHFLRNK